MSLKHDDLYARAWECEYGIPILDAKADNAMPPNSTENPVQSGLSTDETWHKPGTVQECSREIFPRTKLLCNATDTYPYMEPDVDTSSEQANTSPTDPRSSKYNSSHNPKPNFNEDYI